MELLSIVMENAHVNTTRRKEMSPGAGGQLDQGSRPAVALRFHAAVARAAAINRTCRYQCVRERPPAHIQWIQRFAAFFFDFLVADSAASS
jgi:hypothetical protein